MSQIVVSPNSRAISGVSFGGDTTPANPAMGIEEIPGLKDAKITRTGLRRAMAQIGNVVYVLRLRKPNKLGQQTLRDCPRHYRFSSAGLAESFVKAETTKKSAVRFTLDDNEID